ncbi:MAG: glycosyltransferase family 9 protein, partial [Omnitrophica bacterium]|nr:glycosyltransferase family 9 protein [Candidatus Omnitrophota bacterium]
MKPRNILIVNTFGIGDVLFSTPLIRELKRNFPGSNVHYLCNRRNFDLLKNNPDIKSIIVFEKDDFRNVFKRSKIEFFRRFSNFVKKIKKLKADVAIDLTLNYQMSLLLLLAGVRTRIGFNYKNRGKFLTHKIELTGFEKKHVVRYYLDLLKFLNLSVSDNHRLWSYPSEADKAATDNFMKVNNFTGKTLIGFAAGGGKSWGKDAFYRRWENDNFAYIGRKLSEMYNVNILIFGTTEEKEVCDEICEKIGNKSISLCGATELNLFIELVSRCKLFICNEGGPLHVAVSKGVNTISIFGPVDDKVYGPYPMSDRHVVVKAENVACRPCYKNFKHARCETR